MDMKLSPYEARIIGCLLEKQITTPDQYPLSLNALTNACNQKSNRDPVYQLDDQTVQRALDELAKKRLVSERSGYGSRVAKYQQRFCNSEFGSLRFSEAELGIVCELLLRGPQTPGELRARASRLCRYADVHEVESTLVRLMEREDGPFVVRLDREAGRREPRYAHLFGEQVPAAPDTHVSGGSSTSHGPDQNRLNELERLVAELRRDVDMLKGEMEKLTSTANLRDTTGG